MLFLEGGGEIINFFPSCRAPALTSLLTLSKKIEKSKKTIENRYVVEPWRAWRLFRLSEPVRRGQAAMARVRACIDAVLAAAGQKEKEKETSGGVAGGGKNEETIFSRLRAVAPAVAALDRTDDPSACLRREAGLLYFAGIGE